MEIAFLVKHKSEPDVLQGLPAKIKAMTMGHIPHAEPVLTALYQRIVQTPSQTSPVVNACRCSQTPVANACRPSRYDDDNLEIVF